MLELWAAMSPASVNCTAHASCQPSLFSSKLMRRVKTRSLCSALLENTRKPRGNCPQGRWGGAARWRGWPGVAAPHPASRNPAPGGSSAVRLCLSDNTAPQPATTVCYPRCPVLLCEVADCGWREAFPCLLGSGWSGRSGGSATRNAR